jgi:hypothetical protein
MQKQYGERGLVVVTVNIEEAENKKQRTDVESFLKENGIALTNLAPAPGESLAAWSEKWQILGIPLNVIYDRQGKLAKRIEGADLDEMKQQIERLLNEK